MFVVNGQIVKPNEANSSPSQITAMKGSTVRLYWNYTYIGDGIHGGVFTTNFIEQIIGFNSTSQPTIQVLAKRIGQNGILTLQSSIPAYFKGRVEIIPANSTLVIHGLQYNDSSYQFLSTVKATIDSGAGPVLNTYTLKPIVGITVNGMKFCDFLFYSNDFIMINMYFGDVILPCLYYYMVYPSCFLFFLVNLSPICINF